MDRGYLIVSVFEQGGKQPISGANVIVRGENYQERFLTDSNGKTPTIELSAPLKEYSLTPQTQVRPYSIYQLEVSKPGYETTVINGVQVFPDETSLQKVFLPFLNTPSTIQVMATQTLQENIVNLPPHSLWQDTQTPSQNNRDDVRVYPNVLTPEYIIVHDGEPSNTSATKYYVPFIDYIKNVASGEIYSTWPTEALKANIYAIISFTMNRIYTEWYRSQGYNFTITSLPRYDHTFVFNRTIFQSISDVVDQIFDSYIQLPGQNYPFLAQYNDGIRTNNPGWLSQWGSKSLADQGYNAIQILRYYYPSNLTIQTSNDIEGLPTSFPGFNLRLGLCGEPTRQLQTMLNVISNNYPRIPKINPADGQYQESTKRSVEVFQEVFSIPITGIVDMTTWYRISYIYVAVNRMLQT
ncbi:MAG: peptidoglycan-binding protein [Bacilli bacterium]|nr:peptidoglycan-binding protein [Bacilli bacterium]MDD4808521.1 peptidoglycan-binding protein [Bacilli bacterium]